MHNQIPLDHTRTYPINAECDFHQKQAHKANSDYHWQKFWENNQIKFAKSKFHRNTVKANKDNSSGLWKH